MAGARVGLVGCGTVGRRLGSRLLRAGFALRVHDRHRDRAAPLIEAGADWADDAGALAPGCAFLVSCLPGPDEVVAFHLGDQGLWAHAAPRTIHLETSTIGLAALRRLADEARRRQIRLIDAPLSRGPLRDGGVDTSVFVGAAADAFDGARPVLEAIADRIAFCGPVGQGQVAKLINNLVTLSHTVVLGEALALGIKAGAILDLLRAALRDGTAQSRLLDDMLPVSVFRGDWRPGLRLDLAEKDLRLAADLAAECGVPQTLLESVREEFRRAAREGLAELTAHAVVRLVEQRAGVELRSPVLRRMAPPPEEAGE